MARPLSRSARSKMIEAAVEILHERGIDGFTVDEVARQSGVAKSTIYRHFESGDELILASAAAMIDKASTPDTGSLQGDIATAVGEFMAKSEDPALRRFFLSLLTRAIDDPEFGHMQRAMINQRHHSPLRLAIQRGIARGEVDPSIDVEVAIRIVQGPFVMRRLIEDEPVTPAEIDQMLAVILPALAPPSRSAAVAG